MDVYSYVLTVLIKLFMCISRITAILLAATYSGLCTLSNQQYFVLVEVSAIEYKEGLVAQCIWSHGVASYSRYLSNFDRSPLDTPENAMTGSLSTPT